MDTNGLRSDIAVAVQGIATMGGKREITELETRLYESELVEAIAVGAYSGKQGILVLTSERLLFFARGLASEAHEDFPLSRVTSVEWKTGMMTGEITIAASGARAEIKAVQKKDGGRLVDAARTAIRAHMNAHTSRPLPPVAPVPAPVPMAPAAAPASAPAGDPRATLASLKEWHADGLITDEEYSAKRAEVLARI